MKLPTAEFVRAKLWKYHNRWISFLWHPVDWRSKYLAEVGFDISKPILIRGIYACVFKRPKDWPGRVDSWSFVGRCEKPTTFFIELRDVLFIQDGKQATLNLGGSGNRHFNKRRTQSFDVVDIVGQAEFLRGLNGIQLKLPAV